MKSSSKRRRPNPYGKKTSHPLNRPFSILIKPSGPDCNLRCRYCFYLPKQQLFQEQPVHRMSDEVLEQLISGYMSTRQPAYLFNWQGGEPTLMGLDFFQRVIALQRQYAPPGSTITNTIQTNGTLIDAQWAGFLSEHRFLVGVSLDGPEQLHNIYRYDAAEKGAFDRVMAGIEHLRKAGTEFNILTMVTSRSVDRAKEIFNFFMREDFRYQQYIPCVEFDSAGAPLDYTVKADDWGRFMVELFNVWYPEKVWQVSIRNFDNIINLLAAGMYSTCTLRGKCDQYFVVEHNGNVYPCDFFVEEDWKLGSIMGNDWNHFTGSPLYHRFGALKSRWNSACSECRYLAVCSGDCPKIRYRYDRDPASLSYLCEGYRYFFDQTIDRFMEISGGVQQKLQATHPDFRAVGMPPFEVDPADPCFCGSGKRLKNCHGRVDLLSTNDVD